jgi:hypothetical protein
VGAFSTLQSSGQSGKVHRIEADGGAKADGGELAAFDQPLHGARVYVEQPCCLSRRQQRLGGSLRVDMLRQSVTRSDSGFYGLPRSRNPWAAPVAIVLMRLEPGEGELLRDDLTRHRESVADKAARYFTAVAV